MQATLKLRNVHYFTTLLQLYSFHQNYLDKNYFIRIINGNTLLVLPHNGTLLSYSIGITSLELIQNTISIAQLEENNPTKTTFPLLLHLNSLHKKLKIWFVKISGTLVSPKFHNFTTTSLYFIKTTYLSLKACDLTQNNSVLTLKQLNCFGEGASR